MASPTTELKSELLNQLEDALVKRAYHRKGDRFIHRADDVLRIVQVCTAADRRSATVTFSINLAVRHEQVEQLALGWDESLSPKERGETATIGIDLGKLINSKHRSWTLASAEDVPPVVAEILGLLDATGLAYLDEHSDLTAVLRRLESRSFHDWHQLRGGRALRLPVVRALRGDRDRVAQDLIEQQTELDNDNHALATNYSRFAAYLTGLLKRERRR